jgi:DnaJ-domain-containing protein 1
MSAFEILDESPRPFLDSEALKQKFLKLSAPLHPDRVHQFSDAEKVEATQKFSELNQAYQTLKEPKDRLKELLTGIQGVTPSKIQNVPQDLIESSFEVGRLCQEFDLFLKSPVPDSPLPKAVNLSQRKDWLNRLKTLEAQILERENETQTKLLELDRLWTNASDKTPLLSPLKYLISAFSYLARSKHQVFERIVLIKMS